MIIALAILFICIVLWQGSAAEETTRRVEEAQPALSPLTALARQVIYLIVFIAIVAAALLAVIPPPPHS